ncbi:hypothetical protein [Kineobactrum salinum]|uniref:Uncharacterized protein n=1 Tax=Kineobactrum salinum TaxID=2708301 RepID=A0A6C0U5B8_9GAMM|nr:hypothetical protein [Kineobactrum salinum]QIB67176.1 hypothetical protein G3T16_18970 [Kineobactrum salinum]
MTAEAMKKVGFAVLTGVTVTAIISATSWLLWVSRAAAISHDFAGNYQTLDNKIEQVDRRLDTMQIDVVVIREQSQSTKETVIEIKELIGGSYVHP